MVAGGNADAERPVEEERPQKPSQEKKMNPPTCVGPMMV